MILIAAIASGWLAIVALAVSFGRAAGAADAVVPSPESQVDAGLVEATSEPALVAADRA